MTWIKELTIEQVEAAFDELHEQADSADSAVSDMSASVESLSDDAGSTTATAASIDSGFIHLTKTSSAVDNIGGANLSVTSLTWDRQLSTGSEFAHSVTINNHQVTVASGGRYSIKATVSAIQGGAGRTTFMLYPTVNGVASALGVSRNYSRGSAYGDTSNNVMTEIELSAGDKIIIESKVDDTDGVYVSNTQYDQCELIIRKIG